MRARRIRALPPGCSPTGRRNCRASGRSCQRRCSRACRSRCRSRKPAPRPAMIERRSMSALPRPCRPRGNGLGLAPASLAALQQRLRPMNALSQLVALGQSCWLDDLSRRLLASGELARLVEQGVRGVTSNPATFAKAIESGDYDRDIERAAAAGRTAAEIYEELAVADIRAACDILRRVYDESGGLDGYVSLEVSPRLAHDTAASIAEARRLAARVERPNLFIKIPGTPAGLPAIEELLFEGINVNITLLFSVPRYEAVAEAYLRALERRLAAGRPLDRVASVASFFLSRIDVLVDQLLEHRIVPGAPPRDPDPRALRGMMAALERLGIDFGHVTAQLENEGIEKFIEPYEALLRDLEAKRRRYAVSAELQPLREAARRLRRLVIRMTTAAGSGHPTSCLSCADIVAALFFRVMRWDPKDPQARNVDTFVLSKGHAAPVLWAALHEAGAIAEDPLSLRRLDSSLEGHPTATNPWVRIATGALGQGLAAAAGIAAGNRLDGIAARVYCLLGDGECSEGSVWEAAQFAALNKLENLVAIVDVNALGQSGPTPYRHDIAVFARRFAAFGWRTIAIDGHDMAALVAALEEAGRGGPTAILARTVKGKGVSFLEGALGWHGRALDRAQMEQALAELGEAGSAPALAPRRVGEAPPPPPAAPRRIAVSYRLGEEVATRQAFGAALAKLGAADPAVVVLDGDVMNSTGTESFARAHPDRFFQSYIAEQNMVGVALGLAACGKRPFAATFAAFLTRAYDFIRMSQYSRPAHLILCGSHCGVSIGEDGPSQMGLEDLAMFRALIDSTVLYPADAVAAEKLTAAAAAAGGLVYLRTTRPKVPVIYGNDEEFPIGGSKVLRSSSHDRIAIVAAGITVHEALAAHEELHRNRISAR